MNKSIRRVSDAGLEGGKNDDDDDSKERDKKYMVQSNITSEDFVRKNIDRVSDYPEMLKQRLFEI